MPSMGRSVSGGLHSGTLKQVGIALSRGPMSPGDIVHSLGIKSVKGSLGLVKGAYADVAIVSFPQDEGNFKRDALRKLVVGDTVKYIGKADGIPDNEFGIVTEILPTLLVKVQYTASRQECSIPFVALKYIDVRTALGISHRTSTPAYVSRTRSRVV